jgi:hypothetical protein
MQLVLGSVVLPKLAAYVNREEERLGVPTDDERDETNVHGMTEKSNKKETISLSGSNDGSSSDVEVGTAPDIQPASSMEQSVELAVFTSIVFGMLTKKSNKEGRRLRELKAETVTQ